MSEPKLVVDWPAWAQRMKFLGAGQKIELAPGVELVRAAEDNYGSEVRLRLRLGSPDCFRLTYFQCAIEEAERAIDEWWQRQLWELWFGALTSPVQAGEGEAAAKFIEDAPPAIYWLNDTCFTYVPEDAFFRAFVAAEKSRLAAPSTF